MPMWRCPHCGTPQAETARCWVCHRSTTACGNCRHFRRSVAAQLGYCGLDRQRLPLRGNEIRACWESAVTPNASNGPATATDLTAAPGGPVFVPGRPAEAGSIASPEGAARLRPLEPVRHVDLGRPVRTDALDRTPVRRLEFVEVTSTRPDGAPTAVPTRRTARKTRRPATVALAAGDGPATQPDGAAESAAAVQESASPAPRWSLWGEADA